MRVASDNERAVFHIVQIVREIRDTHTMAEREVVRRRIAIIKEHLTKRRRCQCDLAPVRRERHAVREGYTARNDAVGKCSIWSNRDMREPSERESSDRFDNRENMAKRRGKTARHEVVVAHVERRGRRERERIGRDERRRRERAHVRRYAGPRRVEHELLDRRLLAGVVDDEQRRGFAGARGLRLESERVEVVLGGISLEQNGLQRTRVRVEEPEERTGLWVAQRAHDGVPCLAVRVAAQQNEAPCECTLSIKVVPEDDVLACSDGVGGGIGIGDERAVFAVVAACEVGRGEVVQGEDVVFDDVSAAVDVCRLQINV